MKKHLLIILAALLLCTGCASTYAEGLPSDNVSKPASSEASDVSPETGDMSAASSEASDMSADNPGSDPWAGVGYFTCIKFINTTESPVPGMFSANFPDENGRFTNDKGNPVSETYLCSEDKGIMFLGFAILRDNETGKLVRVENPIFGGPPTYYGDYEVTNASLKIHHGEGLYNNAVTLKGDISLTGTLKYKRLVDKSLSDTIVFVPENTQGLPSVKIDPPESSGGKQYFAEFSVVDKNYDTLKAALEEGKKVTITSDEVTLTYPMGLMIDSNMLRFDECEVTVE